VRRALPALTTIKYVAPTVWAGRPGRARAMRPDFDHVLALLPFEPAVMQRLGGPPTTYVGHPLLERLVELQPTPADLAAREREPPLVLLLPGSRPGELARLGVIFGDAAGRVAKARAVELVLPTPASLAAQVQAAIASWPVQPRVVTAEADKFAAFRRARAALAASGTVTLELALARVPMVTAYRVGLLDALLARALLVVDTPILVNIALRERAVPEFLQRACRPDALTATLLPLLTNGPERAAQLAAFTRLEAMMRVDEAPSVRAARVVMECMR
jgi:lipid-A-disaccharide synthase